MRGADTGENEKLADADARGGDGGPQTQPMVPAAMRQQSQQTRTVQGGAFQLALPVPTSFQFGSRDVVSRANVQTSVISATLSGLPSTMVPVLSRVTEIICETNRTVSCAARSRASAPTSSALSIDTKRVSVFCSCLSRSLITPSKLS